MVVLGPIVAIVYGPRGGAASHTCLRRSNRKSPGTVDVGKQDPHIFRSSAGKTGIADLVLQVRAP